MTSEESKKRVERALEHARSFASFEEAQRWLRYWWNAVATEEDRTTFVVIGAVNAGRSDVAEFIERATDEELDEVLGPEQLKQISEWEREQERRRANN